MTVDRSTLASAFLASLLVAACGRQDTTTLAPSPTPTHEPVSPSESATPPLKSVPVVELTAPPEPAAKAPEVALPPTVRVDTGHEREPVLTKLTIARRGKVKSDLVTIESALEFYAIDNSGRYPDSLEPLITPDVNGQVYLKGATLPLDPWKNAYVYEPPGPGNPIPRVSTLGSDGRAGGTGEGADFDNLAIRAEFEKK